MKSGKTWGIVLLLLVGLGTCYFTRRPTTDRQEIRVTYDRFQRALSERQFQSAYELMSEEYRKHHPPDDFESHFRIFGTDGFRSADDYYVGRTSDGIAFSPHGGASGIIFYLVKERRGWCFTGKTQTSID